MMRKIKADEGPILIEMVHQLAEILTAIGVVEYKVSKKEHEIFFDTEGGAQIDPGKLKAFAEVVDKHYIDMLMEKAP